MKKRIKLFDPVLTGNEIYYIKKILKTGLWASGAGIETGTHYPPIHQFSLYKNNHKLPITKNISNSIVTLPTHPNLSESDVNYIIKTINGFR